MRNAGETRAWVAIIVAVVVSLGSAFLVSSEKLSRAEVAEIRLDVGENKGRIEKAERDIVSAKVFEAQVSIRIEEMDKKLDEILGVLKAVHGARK